MEPANPALDAIMNRKSVRRYARGADGAPLPLPPGALDAILEAGMAAPSARDSRPLHFVAVDDRALLEALGSRLKTAAMSAGAAVAIVVCAEPSRMKDHCAPELWAQDCAAAVENILIAAESLGIGAVWTASWPYADRMATIGGILGIPPYSASMRGGSLAVEGIVPFALIPLGIPEGELKPKDKRDPSRIHRNSWLG